MCPLCNCFRLGMMGRLHNDALEPWSCYPRRGCLLCSLLTKRGTKVLGSCQQTTPHAVFIQSPKACQEATLSPKSNNHGGGHQGQSRSSLCQIPPPTIKGNCKKKCHQQVLTSLWSVPLPSHTDCPLDTSSFTWFVRLTT